MRGHRRKINESDRKINMKNKNLMIDKILSYNPRLLEGIEIYKDANRNFILLILFGALLINFPLISVPCCMLSMFYLVKMLKYIKYNSINNIVKVLAKDLSFKGVYDKEKMENMLRDFKAKYGSEICEYTDLVNMLEKYEMFVTKIEYVLKNIGEKSKQYISNTSGDDEVLFNNGKNDIIGDKCIRNNFISKKVHDSYKNINERVSVFYKKENGQVKMVNKAIEFFDNEDAVILKNINKENKNLTVYLYKKSSDLQKNAL